MLRSLCFVPLVMACALPLAAQQNWVVDARSGPGSHFTDIQPAVDAASDGDRIFVRIGIYSGFRIVGKRLSVHGSDGTHIHGTQPVHVANTAPDQSVAITDLTIDHAPNGPTHHGARDCRGRVLLERVFLGTVAARAVFENCDDVRLRLIYSNHGITFTDSAATLTESLILGRGSQVPAPPALALHRTSLTVSRSTVVGQSQYRQLDPSPAASLDDRSVMTLDDDGTHAIQAGRSQVGPRTGIVGSGTVVRDPGYLVRGTSGGPPLDPGITDIVRSIPSLQVHHLFNSHTVDLELVGSGGQPFAVVLGLPISPIELPGIGGAIAVGMPLATFGGAFGSSPVQQSYRAPGNVPLGFQLCWQAIARDAGGGWHVSAPVTYVRFH